MSKRTCARKRAYLEEVLEAVTRDIRAIESSSKRRAGSQLASALGVEDQSHEVRTDKVRTIMEEFGFKQYLEEHGLDQAWQVARALQLFGSIPLRALLAQKRSLEVQLRQLSA